MDLMDLAVETWPIALEVKASYTRRRLNSQVTHTSKKSAHKLALKEQAALIAKLFSQAKIEDDSEDQEHPGPGILGLSDDVLLIVFRFVGTRMKDIDVHNECVNEMLRLKLVCWRFHDLIESNAVFLPKYHLEGIRIQPKEFYPVKSMVVVHRYGTGEFENPCACLPINGIPNFLKNSEIRGNIVVDRVVIDDKLVRMLLQLNLSHVREAVFSNIRVDLNDTTLMNALLIRLCYAESIRFFGEYHEEQLHLDMDSLSEFIERGDPCENREYSAAELVSLSLDYKFKKMRRMVRSITRYQKLEEIGKKVLNKMRGDYHHRKKLKVKQRKLRSRLQ